MKNFKYLLLWGIILLTGALVSGCDPDEPNGGEPDKTDLLNKKIEAIIPADVLSEAKKLGMPIYGGITPPNIEGKYLADDQTMKKSNFENDDPPGTKYGDEVLTISAQNNDNFNVALKSESGSYSNTFSMVISGSGDSFTLYAPIELQVNDKTWVTAVLMYSGKLKDGELHDLHNGTFITDKSYLGLGQVYYEADGVAKKTDGNIIEIIEAVDGTAKGSYKGKDMVMKFPSNLQISIMAAKNQGAPHEEIIITERKENEMMRLGKNLILDFSKTKSAYTMTVETTIDKGLNPEEDIDCSLFTTDGKTFEAANGKIFKKVDFTYDKETGKLALTFLANEPFGNTRASDPQSKYNNLAISLIPDYNFETETVAMKAPYYEQLDNTCWAACAMMFVRSYTNVKGMNNGILSFVREIGHTTLNQGWSSNFVKFWDYDTDNIVEGIQSKIGSGVNVYNSSFRRTKSAAAEMMKLLKQRQPVILNHGSHVIYVIGYKRGENAGTVSFLVHDPQGVSGDMYKWIEWDKYIQKIDFKEQLIRGDALYIIYADKPMLSNPVLQTMAIPAANTENVMCPAGADLTFTMKAFGKSRKVFPRYSLNKTNGIGWGKQGYDEQNAENDTVYAPANLDVAMRVYNADDKPANMLMNMDISGGGVFEYYRTNFNCQPTSVFDVKGSSFKDADNKVFDPKLPALSKTVNDKILRVEFALRNVMKDQVVEELEYEGAVWRPESDAAIILTTALTVGATISLYIDADPADRSGVWMDLNNNRKKDVGESVTTFGIGNNDKPVKYVLGSQTITIYGKIKGLNCGFNEVTYLNVKNCPGLTNLWCAANKIDALDVSMNPELTHLGCHNNRLTSLNVTSNLKLEDLNCSQNQLSSLDVKNNINLAVLWYGNNNISTPVDISKNTELKVLECQDSQLKSIDVSKNTKLEQLFCGHNQLQYIDVSKNTKLNDLTCDGNQLTSLNISKNVELVSLGCSSNQLKALDVSKNTKLTSLYCYWNSINSAEMSKLIGSLPKNTSSTRPKAYVITERTGERNATPSSDDIRTANNKNWRLFKEGYQNKELIP